MEFEKLFMQSKGQPIFYNGRELKMIDRLPLETSDTSLHVEFISTNSTWKQGIVLQTKGDFEIKGQIISNKIILWEHTAPKNVEIKIKSKDKILLVYNAWKSQDEIIHYWHNGGALLLKKFETFTEYYCNDGDPDDDFDDLIFRLSV